jgi:hypothetical protein
MARDRIGDDTLTLTHEFLSIMLGVRRPGVTEALHALRDKGLMSYGRGQVNVKDRKGARGRQSLWHSRGRISPTDRMKHRRTDGLRRRYRPGHDHLVAHIGVHLAAVGDNRLVDVEEEARQKVLHAHLTRGASG